MSFPEYPEYTNSDVQWLGNIPTHWRTVPLWTLFRRCKRTGYPYETLLSVYRDYGVIPKSSRNDNFNKASEDLNSYQLVDIGDLAINKMKAWQGSVAVSKYRGIVSPAYFIYVRQHRENSRFLHYLFRSKEYTSAYLSKSKGIRVNQWDLEPQEHSRMAVLLPPRNEQAKTAAYLDHETVRIDALIEEQQRLIELLKEKRQAVISHAVTKGLDPEVPMKDSGVEWLGAVPAHWEVRKVSFDFAAVKGPRGAILTKEYCAANPGPYPVYSGQTDNAGVLGSIDDFDFSLGNNGGLLTTTVGAKAMSINFVKNNLSLSQNCMLIRPRSNNIFIKFYFYHLQPLFQLERGMIPDHMQPSFRMEDLYGFYVAQPPRQEQKEIAHMLDVEMGKLDALGVEARHLIQRLQERRSALISAAVTGKIDVRNWQAPVEAQTEPYAMAAEPETTYEASRS